MLQFIKRDNHLKQNAYKMENKIVYINSKKKLIPNKEWIIKDHNKKTTKDLERNAM